MPRIGPGPTIAFGLSWDHDKRGRRALLVLATVCAMVWTLAPPSADAATSQPELVEVIVRQAPGTGDGLVDLVERAGGVVTARLGIIDGFAATIPTTAVARLAQHPDVLTVTPDGSVNLSGKNSAPGQIKKATRQNGAASSTSQWSAVTELYFDPATDEGSMYSVTLATDARSLWSSGVTGRGIDIALIDSGVAPVSGLDSSGKIVNGPDLSFDSQDSSIQHLDAFGHGTHMAGIIAGKDYVRRYSKLSKSDFLGMAPEARIVNIKVADAMGNVDISQIIAAIDWVVEHRTHGDLNIRVLNLSFGTDGTQAYQLDPLSFAVENAWRAGIVVVVAAGNEGNDGRMTNPAFNPFVIAVGAADAGDPSRAGDETLATFSSCGTSERKVDVVAPGVSVASLRVPGSSADSAHTGARTGQRYFRGSGTSQAAAVVSGAVALLLDAHPNLTPDQVKASLMETSRPMEDVSSRCQGSGVIDVRAAVESPVSWRATQRYTPSSGSGSLEGARGTVHVVQADVPLIGEFDIFGNTFDSELHAEAAVNGNTWNGGEWNGASWSGASWSGASWSGASWSGASWSGASWSGASWSGASWSGASWSGASWSGASWSSDIWSGSSWSGSSW